MKLGAYQFAVSGDIRENLSKIKEAARRAAEEGVRLLAFPECALTGYPPRDLPASACADFEALAAAHAELQALSDEHDICLIVGTMTRAEAGIRDSAAVFRPGQMPLYYHKRALWGWDRDSFVPGDAPGVLTLDGLRIGVRICYEVRFPEYFRELYRQGTDLNVLLFYDVSDRDDGERYDLLRGHVRTRAVENVCPILTVNAVCPVETAPTLLADASGAVLAEAARGREELLVVDFEPTAPDFGERGRRELSDRLTGRLI